MKSVAIQKSEVSGNPSVAGQGVGMTGKRRFQGLDGVRALAVLMVLLIHSRLLPIGWVGVQTFFVLSGFLITSILRSQVDQPFSDYVRAFYWRRTLRIWPLYFFFLMLCAVAWSVLKIPETWHAAWRWLITFAYNFAGTSPRFEDSNYFGHFWTLCVEEQFYLVWPFVVFFLPLKQFRRLVVVLVLAGPVIRFVTGFFLAQRLGDPGHIQHAVQNLPTSHLDAFASGALLAVLPEDWRQRLAGRSELIFGGAAAVTVAAGLLQSALLWRHGLKAHWLAFGYGGLEHFQQYIWAYSLLNLTSAALIFCAMQDTLLKRLLSVRPLTFIGTISYGLYVWHWPLLHLFSDTWKSDPHSVQGLARFGIYFLTTLAVASLSYFCLERYFLRMKDRSWGKADKSN